jgi:hypothetical protein
MKNIPKIHHRLLYHGGLDMLIKKGNKIINIRNVTDAILLKEEIEFCLNFCIENQYATSKFIFDCEEEAKECFDSILYYEDDMDLDVVIKASRMMKQREKPCEN